MVNEALLFIGSYALYLLILAYVARRGEICIYNPFKPLFSWLWKPDKNDLYFGILDFKTIHEGDTILNVYEDDLIKLTIKPSFVYASFTLENKTKKDIKFLWNDLFVSYYGTYKGKVLHSSVIGKNKKKKQPAEIIKAGGRMVDFIKPYIKHYSHTTPIERYMDTNDCELIRIPLDQKRKRITYQFIINSSHAFHNDRKYVVYLRKKEEKLRKLALENLHLYYNPPKWINHTRFSYNAICLLES